MTAGPTNRESRVTTYWLDPDDRIAHVSASWDRFAHENGGQDVVGASVIGRPLADFITGSPTQMWIDTILGLARVRGETIERPYRCDSPNIRRFMRMEVTPESSGILRLDHTVLATERRPGTYEMNIATPATPVNSRLRMRCSICGRLRRDDHWEEPERLDAELPEPPWGEFTVAYTVCDSCRLYLPKASGA